MGPRQGLKAGADPKRSRRAQERRLVQPSSPREASILKAPNLAEIEWLVHGFSTRQGGISSAYGKQSLNLGRTEHDTAANVERNRALFTSAIGALDSAGSSWPVAEVRQVHSSIIHRITARGDSPVAGDGLVTNVPGLLLGIKTADCLPILVADTQSHAVGAFHAGWRGTVARIAEKGVGEMRKCFSAHPDDMVAAIGPGIHRCCYTVGDEVVNDFASQFSYSQELFEEVYDFESLHNKYPMLFLNQRAPGHGEPATKIQLDLAEANRRQLLNAGIPAKNIFVFDECTACHPEMFFSYRAEHGRTGRMMAAIGIRR